jgi:endonuclease V-like protein UPF0215 family
MINEKANRLQDSYNLIVDVHKYVDDLIVEAKKIDGGFSTKQIANIVQSVFGENSYNIAFTYILNKRGLL